ncbi:MAG: Do family serine endopeptidase [Spirochaetaceae bacterium]|jgi:serine protease Do|nr:Do family serine endopeptidase [Spirochaetaceae bacterium]
MKLKPTFKVLLIAGFIFLSTIIGFVSAFTLFDKNINNDGIESVFAESKVSDNFSNALSLQNVFRKVSAETLPVVVLIEAVEISSQGKSQNNNPFNYFFGPGNGENDKKEEGDIPQEFRSSGLGSGIIVEHIKSTYYVLTNNHVAGNADELTVRLSDERFFKAKLVGKDQRKDLALISFETKEELLVAKLGDSDDLYVGDFVLAIGNPFGYQSTVTSGIISALGRQQGPENNISDFIQTDAAINQGNSGGALVNLNGEVIGINTWITTPTGGSIGLGFSVPINNAKKTIADILKSGETEYGWLGVSIGNVSDIVAKDMSLDSTTGAFVSQVFKNSPAEKGGIIPGDIILSIDGKKTKNSDELLYLVGDIYAGTRTVFQLVRDKVEITVNVIIEKRLSEDKIQELSNTTVWPGISVLPLNDEIRKNLKLEGKNKGIVVFEVYPKTAIQIAGIKSGDLITEINDVPISNLNDFYQNLNNNNKIIFKYIREGVTLESSTINN